MGHTVAKLGTGGDGRQARTRRTVHNHAMWGALWPSGRSTGYRPHNSRLSIGRGHSAVQWSTCSLRKE